MKKTPALLLLLTILIFSCQKEVNIIETNPTPIPQPKATDSCKTIKAYLYDDYTGTTLEDSASYEYSGSKIVKIYFDNDKQLSFEYNGDRIVKRVYSAVGAPTAYNYYSYSYNANGLLASAVEKDISFGTNQTIDSLSFVYVSDKISNIKRFAPNSSGTLVLEDDFQYFYQGNNISKQYGKYYNNGMMAGTDSTVFTYDGKPNYLRKQNADFLLTDPFFFGNDTRYFAFFFSENNVIKEEDTSHSFSATWDYIADSKGNLTDLRLAGHPYLRYSYKCP